MLLQKEVISVPKHQSCKKGVTPLKCEKVVKPKVAAKKWL